MNTSRIYYILSALLLLPATAFAGASADTRLVIDAINNPLSYVALGVFCVAYLLVIFEEFIHMRKSKPVIFASGVIWVIVAYIASTKGMADISNLSIKHTLLEFSELFLFLLVAMTYVNAMEERNVFETLRVWLVTRGYSYKQLFCVTGVLAFFISPIADNLTTALLMCAVIVAVAKDNKAFISISCVNIVVAANAGGAFSPFGDITTLMVWQAGEVPFATFFKIFWPSVVSYVIPAAIMLRAVPNGLPEKKQDTVVLLPGAITIVFLFLATISTAVFFHNVLHLPPAVGMMTGLSYLKLFGYYLKLNEMSSEVTHMNEKIVPFDIIKKVERAEWDTLLFFYGVIVCVGGLSTIGYLELASGVMYEQWGAGLDVVHKQTPANIMVGIASAIVDNIPVMYAVLTMDPNMSQGQWLLATLTAGIGGSLLSVGSAAGVALMGQSKGMYTFFGHLRWSWAILIGYFVAIWMHIEINRDIFNF